MRAGEVFKVKAKNSEGKMVDKEINMLDVVMDAASLASVGTMVGSGGVMVMDDSREMVWVLNNLNQFYANESCGQCTPCREGSLWMSKITSRMLDGGGTTGDPKSLKSVADNIAGRTVCAFGEACSWPTRASSRSSLRNSRQWRQETRPPNENSNRPPGGFRCPSDSRSRPRARSIALQPCATCRFKPNVLSLFTCLAVAVCR